MGIANIKSPACILGVFTCGIAVEGYRRGTNISDARLLIKLRWCKSTWCQSAQILLTVWCAVLKLEVLNSGVWRGVMLGARLPITAFRRLLSWFNSNVSALPQRHCLRNPFNTWWLLICPWSRPHRNHSRQSVLQNILIWISVLGKPSAQVYKRKYWIWRLLLYKETARIKERSGRMSGIQAPEWNHLRGLPALCG